MTSPAAPLRAAYLDSSALVKLVVPEPETLALRTAILDENWQLLVTSTLAHTEVLRAVAVAAPSAATERRARAVLATVVQLDVSADVLERAATLRPATVPCTRRTARQDHLIRICPLELAVADSQEL